MSLSLHLTAAGPRVRPHRDPQGSDDAEDQAGQPEDLKVVVCIKGGRAAIGVQQPPSDPHIESFDDRDLTGLTQEVSAVIERARAKWGDAPKYPAHARPAPRPSVSPGVRKVRCRPGPPREGQTNSNPRR